MRVSRVFLAAIIVFVQVNSFAAIPFWTGNTGLDRTLPDRFSSIAIQNLAGKTEIQTWNSTRVRVLASRSSGNNDPEAIESRIRFQTPTPSTLIIVVRNSIAEGPINLTVFVPRQSNLSVRGGEQAVSIHGVTNSLTVETDSGNVSFHIPDSANADLSLRALEATISSNLPLTIFGPVNAHTIDGRIGSGGAPVILRSTKGALELLPDQPGRLARADAQIANDRSNGTITPIVKRIVNSNDDSDQDATSGPSATDGAAADEAVAIGNSPRLSTPLEPTLDVVKIDSRLVNLNVRVTDGSGKLITDLAKEDFEVFEDNTRQEVVRFEPVSSPVNVVMLLDLSGSTKDRWKIIKKAAKKFIDTLSPNTPIAVAAFTRKFLLISDFTLDRKLLKDRIENTKNRGSGTAFYDGTWSTLDLFKKVADHRKAIVVMTDGVDNSLSSDEYEARHPFDELLARITQDEVTIYPIYFDTEFEVVVKQGGSDTHESYETARRQLQQIADETGGTLFRADRAEDLEGVYQRVASELQTLYSVSYNPLDKNYDGKWRGVAVKVKRSHAAAKTKRGFYAR